MPRAPTSPTSSPALAAGDGDDRPPSQRRDAEPQDRLPALVLPPPPPRRADRRRPDRRRPAAEEGPDAAEGARLLRGQEAARVGLRRDPRRPPRPRDPRGHVRLRAAGVGDGRPRGRLDRPRSAASCAPTARARRSGSCPLGREAGAAVKRYLRSGRGELAARQRRPRALPQPARRRRSPARASTRSSRAAPATSASTTG